MDLHDPWNKIVAADVMPWSMGDQIFASVQAILDAQQARLVPPGGLTQQKAAKSNELRAAATKVVNGGFMSTALGSPHVYPSMPAARADMTASVTASLLPDLPQDWTTPFWCADANGDEALRDHTVDQIRKAGSDGKAMMDTAEQNLAGLLAQVDAAQDVDALGSIIWRGDASK